VERDLILDAGALIDVERGSETVIALTKQVHSLGGDTVIPASVLAQVWRGGPKAARLSRLVAGSDIDTLGEYRAKEIGARLGDRGARDVTDAHVACCAIERRGVIATSDQHDIEALVGPDEPVRLIAV
jgi:predicted nucleic acid-binding protein